MTRVATFAEIETEFIERAHGAVYAVRATVGPDGRPRTRVVHPVWDGATGWIATFPGMPKEADLAGTPHVSLAYIADPVRPAYAECLATREVDAATKRRVWAFIRGVPAPAGFDPAPIYGAPDDPRFALLRLAPWRVRLPVAGDKAADRVWQA